MTALRNLPFMALGLLALPFMLFGLILRAPLSIALWATKKRDTTFDAAYLRKHLVVEAVEPKAHEAQVAALQDKAKTLAIDQDWQGAATWFAQLDRSRAALGNGERQLYVALNQFRFTLCEFYESPLYCNEEFAFHIPEGVMVSLKAALDADPDNYALAALLGLLHLDCGWAARGNDTADQVADGDWQVMNLHYDEARKIVTRFDAVAYDSPLLAEVQYTLNTGIENGADRLQDTIDDWVDLDPTDPRAYRRHAFHCLDRWFGDAEFLVAEADRLATRKSAEMGDAAYALMICHGLTYQEDIAPLVDIPRYLQGIDALLVQAASDPLALLRLFKDATRGATPVKTLSSILFHDEDHAAMADIKPKLLGMMRSHVRSYVKGAWFGGIDDFLQTLAAAYQAELERGATVTIDMDGVRVTEADQAAA